MFGGWKIRRKPGFDSWQFAVQAGKWRWEGNCKFCKFCIFQKLILIQILIEPIWRLVFIVLAFWRQPCSVFLQKSREHHFGGRLLEICQSFKQLAVLVWYVFSQQLKLIIWWNANDRFRRYCHTSVCPLPKSRKWRKHSETTGSVMLMPCHFVVAWTPPHPRPWTAKYTFCKTSQSSFRKCKWDLGVL